MEKRFSIIITTYNVEDYVRRAVDSVLSQSFDNYEIIVADDCSSDNTKSIVLSEYGDKVIFCSTEKNSGTAAGPRNKALDIVAGEYILFLDGDDEMHNTEVLRSIDNLIKDGQPDIIYLGYQDSGNGDNYRLSTRENSTKEARILCDVSFSVSSKCWRKEFLDKNNLRFKEGMYYEDQLFSMQGNVFSENTIYGEFPIFRYYRNRENSIMTTPSVKKCSDLYRVMAEIVDLYEKVPAEYRKYLSSFIKNENDSLPLRIANNLYAIATDKETFVLPKRDYGFTTLIDLKSLK